MSLSSARGFAACPSINRFALSMANSRPGFYQTPRNRLLAVANEPFTSLFSTVGIKVRLNKTEKEFENIVINDMVKDGWGPGLQDAECFMACDPTVGFHDGRLLGLFLPQVY